MARVIYLEGQTDEFKPKDELPMRTQVDLTAAQKKKERLWFDKKSRVIVRASADSITSISRTQETSWLWQKQKKDIETSMNQTIQNCDSFSSYQVTSTPTAALMVFWMWFRQQFCINSSWLTDLSSKPINGIRCRTFWKQTFPSQSALGTFASVFRSDC